MTDELTHLDSSGTASMVDVGDKPSTRRDATARGFVRMAPSTLALVQSGNAKKGDVLGTARIAGIMAAKRTGDLIPLCHPIGLDRVEVRFAYVDGVLAIEATASCTGRTGVEMEAMTAVSVAALTIYDMCKAVDRGMELFGTHLARKSGGKSGDFTHPAPPGPSLEDVDWV